MAGQIYSDKFYKHHRSAEKAEDNMQRAKAVAEQAQNEECTTERWQKHEMAQEQNKAAGTAGAKK